MKIMRETLGDIYVVIAREITKQFEEVLRGTLTELIDKITVRPLKGEIVVLFNPAYKP